MRPLAVITLLLSACPRTPPPAPRPPPAISAEPGCVGITADGAAAILIVEERRCGESYTRSAAAVGIVEGAKLIVSCRR